MFNGLIDSELCRPRKEKCKKMQKILQKNLEDKKKSVSLQPV